MNLFGVFVFTSATARGVPHLSYSSVSAVGAAGGSSVIHEQESVKGYGLTSRQRNVHVDPPSLPQYPLAGADPFLLTLY